MKIGIKLEGGDGDVSGHSPWVKAVLGDPHQPHYGGFLHVEDFDSSCKIHPIRREPYPTWSSLVGGRSSVRLFLWGFVSLNGISNFYSWFLRPVRHHEN
jgi:hypothetical protein